MTSTFQNTWTNKTAHPIWSQFIRRVPNDPHSVYCSWCRKAFSVRSMGAQAIRSHEKSKGHCKEAMKMKTQAVFFTKPTNINSNDTVDFTDSIYTQVTDQSQASSSQQAVDQSKANIDPQAVDQSKARSSQVNVQLDAFTMRDDVLKAELLWTLNAVSNNHSFRSADENTKLMKEMFPDSRIAQQFSMGRDKFTYLACHGLAPYFKQGLKERLINCENFVICFDESLNQKLQRGQMDIHVRFFDEELQQVVTAYYNSVFLGRSTSSDIGDAFKEGIEPLPIRNVLQISMDGPSVNKKFYKNLTGELSSSPNATGILDSGTCGLHTINNAFQAGHTASGWDVNGFLRHLYWLFKDCPARRAAYSELTGSDIFPAKFCAVRWLENSKAVERAVKMIPFLQKWIEEPSTKMSGNKNFLIVKSAVSDRLILAKLHFFKFVSLTVEPFLRRYQSPAPLSPYLYESVECLIRSFMISFVKPKNLIEATTLPKLCDINFNDSKTWLRKPEIGFGAREAISTSTDDEANKFYDDCRKFLLTLTDKVIQKLVTNIRCFRDASCISPSLMKTKGHLSIKRLDSWLKEMVRLNRISEDTADRAKLQFIELLNDTEFMIKLENFDFSVDRLDSFFVSFLSEKAAFADIFCVIKSILILSHGNATVESEFSINENCLRENLQEETLISLRVISSQIRLSAGIFNIPITKEMLGYARGARLRYREALDKKKVTDRLQQNKAEARKRAREQFEELQAKRVALRQQMEAEDKLLMDQMKDLRSVIAK